MAPKKRVTKKEAEAAAAAAAAASASTNATTAVSEPVDNNDEHVLLHLPIHSDRLSELTFSDTILEYNPVMCEPSPYDPSNQFMSSNDEITTPPAEAWDKKTAAAATTASATASATTATTAESKVMQKCFWCCHDVGHEVYGMPIRYDVLNKNFAMYGTFCSLECASAFNFSHHLGSDRAWEIHSWIQMLGKRFGYKEPIRPAPSKYLLKMFNGPLTIEEFRKVHKTQSRTLVLNIPPLISVPSQMEMINTSFLGSAPTEKKKRTRTIDTKMKLLVQTDPDPTEAAAA